MLSSSISLTEMKKRGRHRTTISDKLQKYKRCLAEYETKKREAKAKDKEGKREAKRLYRISQSQKQRIEVQACKTIYLLGLRKIYSIL